MLDKRWYPDQNDSCLELARRTGAPFYVELVRGLNQTTLGPERARLCRQRRYEAQEVLGQVLSFVAFAEESLASSGQLSANKLDGLESTLNRVSLLCHRLDHAVEILEANSRACREGEGAMCEYDELYSNTAACNIRISDLSRRIASHEERRVFASLLDALQWPCCVSRSTDLVVVVSAEPSKALETINNGTHLGGESSTRVPACKAKTPLPIKQSKAPTAVAAISEVGSGLPFVIVKIPQFGGVFTCLAWLIS